LGSPFHPNRYKLVPVTNASIKALYLVPTWLIRCFDWGRMLVLIYPSYHILCRGAALGHHCGLKLCPWRDIYDGFSYVLRSAPKMVVTLRRLYVRIE
jgi:hypothetical protein